MIRRQAQELHILAGFAAAISLVIALAAAAAPAAAEESGEMHITEGVLQMIAIKTLNAPKDVGVIVRLFPADRADLGTAEKGDVEKRVDAAKMMQREGPRILAEKIVEVLSLGGVYKYAKLSEEEKVPEDSIVVEGRITRIEPGKRVQRGFLPGVGKSGITVEGVVKSAKGDVLAEFMHFRKSGWGIAGGDYVKFLMDDTRDVASDIALFLKRWATGGDLHKGD